MVLGGRARNGRHCSGRYRRGRCRRGPGLGGPSLGRAGRGGSRHRGGIAGVSQFLPFGVGLGGLPEQDHVAQQHDGRRHDHPPGRQLGDRERARSDGQGHEQAEQPPARGQHPLVLLAARAAAGDLAASRRHLRPGRRSRIFPPPRSGSRLRDDRRVRFCRGEIVPSPLAGGTGGVPPKPARDEHGRPNDDDGDIQDRAAQGSSPRGLSPRRGERRAARRRIPRASVAGTLRHVPT
jgi:hypothetical protein